jgi:hypothetical protein
MRMGELHFFPCMSWFTVKILPLTAAHERCGSVETEGQTEVETDTAAESSGNLLKLSVGAGALPAPSPLASQPRGWKADLTFE